MELKNYQKAVIRDLERYLEILMQTKNIETAYTRLWQEKDVKVGFGGMPKYQNLLPGVPNVCLKVPTGGGKTFLAANAIEPIFSALGVVKRRAVVWLVPSDAILTQTLAALRDPAHPYRQKIDVAFGSRVYQRTAFDGAALQYLCGQRAAFHHGAVLRFVPWQEGAAQGQAGEQQPCCAGKCTGRT